MCSWFGFFKIFMIENLLSYYLANKRSLHVRSQSLKILTLIGEKKLPTTAITIKFVQNTLMPN